MDGLVNWMVDALKGINPIVIVIIISLMPILELRGGLIAATLLKVPFLTALPVCIIANFLPIPFILLIIKAIFKWMRRFEKIGRIADKLEKKALSKKDQIEKYEFWGLVLFVGIPLPGTGAWTGSLIAALLDVDFKKAVGAVILGILLAAVIVSIFSYGILGNLLS